MTPFAQLCLLIRCALGNEPDPARAISAARIDGEAVAVLSFRHRVAAFLHRLVLDPDIGPLLPANLRDCLVFAHWENGRRNQGLRAQLADILGRLNAEGIEPVLLKGAGRLVDDIFPDPAARFLLDLDLLVALPRIETATRALQDAGYQFSQREARLADEYHHLPSLWREDALAAIELHRTAIAHWNDRLLPTAALHRRASRVELDGHRARLPTPEDGLMHLVVHGQSQHHRLVIGAVLLSEVVEAVLLARRFGGLVDRVREQAGERGFALGLATFLRVCELTTGERIAAGAAAPRGTDLLARRCVWQQEHERMRAPGRMLVWLSGGVLVVFRHPSVFRRLPGRFAEKEFYANRWQEIRRVFSR